LFIFEYCFFIDSSINKKRIILFGLGIVTFIVGFVFLSFVAWWLNGIAGVEDIVWETVRRGIIATGAYALVGLVFIAIGMILTVLSKFEK